MPPEPRTAILVALLIATLHLWASIAFLQRTTRERTVHPRRRLRRPAHGFGRNALLNQFAIFALLVFLNDDMESWNAESVGLVSKWAWPVAIAVGLACYAVFYVTLTAVLHLVGNYDRVADDNTRVLTALWPRRQPDKLFAAIAIWLSNPFTEELLFRGIAVHQLAIVCESTEIAIAVGLLVHTANHAYQGLRALTTHVPFYVIVVALMYSPTGLWGAIGFHLAGDVVPFLLIGRAVREYRRRHRNRVPTQQAQAGTPESQ